MYGIHVLDLHIQGGQTAVDILRGRPEVDAERIGCIGNSYGGRMAMWLSIFEPRLKACVSAGAMNTFRERSLKLSSCAIQYFPGILKYGDVPDLYGLIAPRPLQLQAGENDPLLTPADRDHIERTVRTVYREFGAEEHFDYLLHPGGHLLVWELAEPFLCRHLRFQRFHRP
jgi:dienelactone hydrolase